MLSTLDANVMSVTTAAIFEAISIMRKANMLKMME